MTNNLIRGFLSDNPEIAYQYHRPQQGSQNFTNYWRNNYSRVMQDYYGDYVKRLMSGQPIVGMSDYMKNYNYQQNWQNLTPGARGEYATAFRPQTRWNLAQR